MNNAQPSYWELIKVYSPSLENDIKYWFGSCPVSSTEILVFGGKKMELHQTPHTSLILSQSRLSKQETCLIKTPFIREPFFLRMEKSTHMAMKMTMLTSFQLQAKHGPRSESIILRV